MELFDQKHRSHQHKCVNASNMGWRKMDGVTFNSYQTVNVEGVELEYVLKFCQINFEKLCPLNAFLLGRCILGVGSCDSAMPVQANQLLKLMKSPIK